MIWHLSKVDVGLEINLRKVVIFTSILTKIGYKYINPDSISLIPVQQ